MDNLLSLIISNIFSVPGVFLILVIIMLKSSIKFVPQNRAYVVERFGKFQSTKEAGLNFILPFVDHLQTLEFALALLARPSFELPSHP